jgi:hypothetical protein
MALAALRVPNRPGFSTQFVHWRGELSYSILRWMMREQCPPSCEYPWETAAGQILVPAEYDFGLNLHTEKAAVTMIKEVQARATELAAE